MRNTGNLYLLFSGLFYVASAALHPKISALQGEMRMISNNLIYPAARAVTTGRRHHFFGYYDKFPWDKSGRYLLGLETTFIDRPPTPDDYATIGFIDLADNNRWILS